MRKRTPPLEWRIVEDEEEWERQQAQNVAVAPLTGWRRYRQKRTGNVIALLLLLVMAGAWWRTFQANQQQKAAATVRPPSALREVVPRLANKRAGAPSSQSSSDGQMLTEGVTAAPREQSLATTYFVYHFHQQDAAVVRAVALQMDQLYTTLWHTFGLPLSPRPDKLVIAVSGASAPAQIALRFDAQPITIPSPGFYPTPVNLTNANQLAQSIALPLLHLALAQAKERYGIQAGWQPLLDGLYLWQLWDAKLPLAAWREAVVKWQYIDLPAVKPGQPFVLPKRYQELCTDSKLWLPSLARIHFPLVCAGQAWEERNWQAWRANAPVTRLAQLAAPSTLTLGEGASSLVGPPFFFNHPGQTVALTTLVEYAVSPYGHERLPALVAGLGHYDRWETLLPAVFGVSAAEFEAGWQAYLAAHYGVASKSCSRQRSVELCN